MTQEKIQQVLKRLAEEAKLLYGSKLKKLILYGSCARGDFQPDSDIDVLVLLDVPQENIADERRRFMQISDNLDLEYDIVLTPVFQSAGVYERYMPVSVFYQNVQREGILFA